MRKNDFELELQNLNWMSFQTNHIFSNPQKNHHKCPDSLNRIVTPMKLNERKGAKNNACCKDWIKSNKQRHCNQKRSCSFQHVQDFLKNSKIEKKAKIFHLICDLTYQLNSFELSKYAIHPKNVVRNLSL